MKKILVIIGLVVFLFLNIVVTFADETTMQAPGDRTDENTSGLMRKICYNGSMITGSAQDICNDCDDCNYYLGRRCLGTKDYCD